jgi:hypothetical protein
LIGIQVQESGNGLGSTHNIYFNSVRLSPSGLSCQNSCLEIGTVNGPVFKIFNNILANFTSSQSLNTRIVVIKRSLYHLLFDKADKWFNPYTYTKE